MESLAEEKMRTQPNHNIMKRPRIPRERFMNNRQNESMNNVKA